MTLVEADSRQKIARDRLTFPEWGAKLDKDQFLDRERRLRRTAWARQGMKTWLYLGKGGEVLSSCETFRMNSRVDLGSTADSGHTYAIASVYTEPHLRGQGHATRMLSRLVEGVAESASRCQAFILYSEVGAAIYERIGFRPLPSFDRVFSPQPLRGPAAVMAVRVSREEIGKHVEALSLKPVPGFGIQISRAQLAWHFEREACYADYLGRPGSIHGGAVMGDAVVAWMVDHKVDELRVLYLAADQASVAMGLINVASAVAHELGLRGVRVWESEHFGAWRDLSLQSRRESREDALAMIRPVAPAVEARHWAVISRSLWV